jgi:hypothetical protein
MTPAPVLSVCSLTAGPGPRLATILEELRAVADEIIVAVDARVDTSRLGHHARVADRIVRFEFAPPIERGREAVPKRPGHHVDPWHLAHET